MEQDAFENALTEIFPEIELTQRIARVPIQFRALVLKKAAEGSHLFFMLKQAILDHSAELLSYENGLFYEDIITKTIQMESDQFLLLAISLLENNILPKEIGKHFEIFYSISNESSDIANCLMKSFSLSSNHDVLSNLPAIEKIILPIVQEPTFNLFRAEGVAFQFAESTPKLIRIFGIQGYRKIKSILLNISKKNEAKTVIIKNFIISLHNINPMGSSAEFLGMLELIAVDHIEYSSKLIEDWDNSTDRYQFLIDSIKTPYDAKIIGPIITHKPTYFQAYNEKVKSFYKY